MTPPEARNTLRVVHVPARTPYAWKLHGPDFRILNSTTIDDGSTVPSAVTAEWLLEHRPFTWFDVLHLHHIEFEAPETLERLLDACASAEVRIVHTVHDTTAMFGSDRELHQRLRTLATADVGWICLTPGSASALTDIIGRDVNAAVIPHGYVADPEALSGQQRHRGDNGLRYLLFGATRPNRDQLSTVVNWSLAATNPDDRLHLLLRGLSPAHFRDPTSQVPQLLDAIRSDQRITTTMRSYPTDDEVIAAGLAADALLLPYLWGSHSGQLELAFDLNLLPICSSVGYLLEQVEQHKGLVAEPEWFDWSTGNPYLFGERFIGALERASLRSREADRKLDPQFLEYRREEHREILDSYLHVYEGRSASTSGVRSSKDLPHRRPQNPLGT